jgi:hypothetical protein
MGKKLVFTKILAIGGTVLVWLPILMALFFSAERLITRRHFNLDYLLPLELFPVILIGGGLLLWAALRVRSFIKWIAWGLGMAVGLLILSQGLAVVLGLASGEAEPSGWRFALVISCVVVYSLAVIFMGVGGGLLIRDLFKASQTVKN